MRIAIAIPTFEREQVLISTIEHALRQSRPADEVLVVDQTPEHLPEVSAKLEQLHTTGRIRWIRQSPPNLPKARNRALQESTSDVVLFIDDDVELPIAFVQSHLTNYLNDSHVAAVAGRTIQSKGWGKRPLAAAWPRILDYKYFRLDGLQRKEWVASFVGCNHSVRREVMLSLGGYDENFVGWAYREDSDAAIRLFKEGFKVVFDPESVLLHLAAPAGGCRPFATRKKNPDWMLSFPAIYFAFKHFYPSRYFFEDVGIHNVRKYVFRREFVLRPQRILPAILAYLSSAIRAFKAYAKNPRRRPSHRGK